VVNDMKLKAEGVSVSLSDVLARVGLEAEASHVYVTGITHDNRAIEPGFVFAALKGEKFHGINFALTALEAGAAAILTDAEGASQLGRVGVPIIVSANPRFDMGEMARVIYGDAQSQLIKVGITGTNGKTTTAHMVFGELQRSDLLPLMIGTVGVRIGDSAFVSSRTTPESTDLHSMFLAAQQQGAKSLVMEVSSHAIALGRVAGIVFDVAVFTGLSQDHLDFHGSMEDYFSTKAALFTPAYARHAVICVDDEWGMRLAAQCELPTVTYGSMGFGQWRPQEIKTSASGATSFVAVGPVDSFEVSLNIPGDFNIANSLAAIAVGDILNLSKSSIVETLASVSVAGRLERVHSGQDFVALVDYAHTPDAVDRVLQVARNCASGRVIAVLGCGGDRDSTKRGPMGLAAAAAADVVVVTDDNPRTEDPAVIRSAVIAGATDGTAEIVEIGNRLQAIHHACKIAQPGDCVIILGKGHELGQDVNGVISPFDDRNVLAEAIRAVVQ